MRGILLVLFMSAPSLLGDVEVAKPTLYHIKVERVIDGDTIVGDIVLPWKVTLRDQHIRCLGYDAWEMRDLKGLAARKALVDLLKDGELYGSYDKDNDIDNFGRPLSYLYVKKGDTFTDIALYMENNGHCKSN